MQVFSLLLVGLAASELYCPSKNDLVVAYCHGNKTTDCPAIQNGGWNIHGGGSVTTKSAFDLIGGYVEFDLDVSGVESQVNANVYTISPDFSAGSYNHSSDYCDGATNVYPWCTEMDWIESNGDCGGATTIHTKAGPGEDGCTAWGCTTSYYYNGTSKFHMRVEYADDGTWTVFRNGQQLTSFSPQPNTSAWSIVRAAYEDQGAVIVSSQWQGWVPLGNCSGQRMGSLADSKFEVTNLKVFGKVVQGPIPQLCAVPAPTAPALYCPNKHDLAIAFCHGNRTTTDCPVVQDGGWRIHGGGGVATKSAFNLIGGYVEFDFDVSGVEIEVNANVYTISPNFSAGSFNQSSDYCDGASNDLAWCTEMDLIESNGAVGGATTIHTKPGPGEDGCTAWGCAATYYYNGTSKFHMRAEFADDGTWTVSRDGRQLTNFSPQPDTSAWSVVKAAYENQGAVIYSSLWQGWVPLSNWTTPGSLTNSKFEVSNLKVYGRVTQGPIPHLCAVSNSANILMI